MVHILFKAENTLVTVIFHYTYSSAVLSSKGIGETGFRSTISPIRTANKKILKGFDGIKNI